MILKLLEYFLKLVVVVTVEKDRLVPVEVGYTRLKANLLQNLYFFEGVHLSDPALHLRVGLG